MKGIIGIDEVGRGHLAGPVTLCAVYIEDHNIIKRGIFNNTIRDSKKLSKLRRNNIYLTIRKNKMLETKIVYAISSRSTIYIDRHGINKAVEQCLLSCMRELLKKNVSIYELEIHLDAGLYIPIKSLKQRSFIKGDENYVEIALASILAKEYRDNYMKKISSDYKEYYWENNVGYGTLKHREAIRKYGATRHHRRSYLRAFKFLKNNDEEL